MTHGTSPDSISPRSTARISPRRLFARNDYLGRMRLVVALYGGLGIWTALIWAGASFGAAGIFLAVVGPIVVLATPTIVAMPKPPHYPFPLPPDELRR